MLRWSFSDVLHLMRFYFVSSPSLHLFPCAPALSAPPLFFSSVGVLLIYCSAILRRDRDTTRHTDRLVVVLSLSLQHQQQRHTNAEPAFGLRACALNFHKIFIHTGRIQRKRSKWSDDIDHGIRVLRSLSRYAFHCHHFGGLFK